MVKLNQIIGLSKKQEDRFLLYQSGWLGDAPTNEVYYGYYLSNKSLVKTDRPTQTPNLTKDPTTIQYNNGTPSDTQTNHKSSDADESSPLTPPVENAVADGKAHLPTSTIAGSIDRAPPSDSDSVIGAIISIFNIWIIMPFVFLFLLIDSGQIKKYFVRLVPNQYFEMSLSVIDQVDEALGRYLRGTLLECSLVGLTFIIGLFLIGVEPMVAVLIGITAGLANAIPFLGPLIGLAIGVFYALIAEDVQPLLPFISKDNLLLGVFLTVGIAQLLDNAIYQPFVLGSAVNLHPLVVLLGVIGGSIIFGFAGMLLAIPAIVIINVITATLITQLKSYEII